MAQLPLSFVENRGQMPDGVRFYARDAQADLLFTASGFTTRLRQGAPDTPPAELRVQMAGARAGAAPVSLERAEGVVNILQGNDPARWLTGIPTHARIGYTAAWPGIDVRYDGSGGRLESTYAVSAGADPALVRLRYSGHDGLSLTPDGGLLVRMHGGLFSESAPVIYQEIGAGRVSVDGRFDIVDHDTVGFVVAKYDHDYPLLIDPVSTFASLAYSTYFGGTGNDQANAVAVDSTGAAYIAGFTTSTSVPNNLIGLRGARDAFVLKLTPAGTVSYLTYIGGATGDDEAKAIAVSAGEAYITGSTTSTDFPTPGTPFQALSGGGIDAFVTRLNSTGTGPPLYSTYLGGAGDDTGRGIAVNAGKVFVTGTTLSDPFPLSTPFVGTPLGGLRDAFVTELDPAGATPALQLVYSRYLGGSLPDDGRAIAVDTAGNAYVTGSTGPPTALVAANFPTLNAVQSVAGLAEDAFVTSLSTSGAILYSTYLGGNGVDGGYGIAIDGAANVYVTGLTHSTDYPTLGPLQVANGGGDDAFVTKLHYAAPTLTRVYSTYVGGSLGDGAAAIAVNAAGEAFITGSTFSTNFPMSIGFQPTHGAGVNADAFVTRINAAGSAYVYSSYLGGSSTDRGWGIALDGSSNAFVAGATTSSNLPTRNPYQLTYALAGDAFAAKIALVTASVGGVSTAPDPASLPLPRAGGAGASVNPGALAILTAAALAATGAMAYARRRRA